MKLMRAMTELERMSMQWEVKLTSEVKARKIARIEKRTEVDQTEVKECQKVVGIWSAWYATITMQLNLHH
jgi:hypothetical protein